MLHSVAVPNSFAARYASHCATSCPMLRKRVISGPPPSAGALAGRVWAVCPAGRDPIPSPPEERGCFQAALSISTLCCAIVLPGRNRAGNLDSGPDLGGILVGKTYQDRPSRRPAGGPILMFSRLASGRNPARKLDFRPGSTFAQHRVVTVMLG